MAKGHIAATSEDKRSLSTDLEVSEVMESLQVPVQKLVPVGGSW